MSYANQMPGLAFPSLTPAIKRLLLANVAVFVANMLLGGRLTGWFAFGWEQGWDGYGLGWLRLLSYQFTHSFADSWHLLMNMLVLYFFGTMAEGALGYRGTYKLYLVGGIVAALVHLGTTALMGRHNVPMVGASGSCYAFLVYAACMAPRSIVFLLFFPIPLGVLAGGLVFLGAYSMYVEIVTGYAEGIAHSAHLGGAAFGFLAYRRGWFRDWVPYVYQGGLFQNLGKRWQELRRARGEQRREADRRELDRLLEKVHASGMDSLTGAERRFLQQQSHRH